MMHISQRSTTQRTGLKGKESTRSPSNPLLSHVSLSNPYVTRYLFLVLLNLVWLSGAASSSLAAQLTVDPHSLKASLSLFQEVYQASNDVDIDWQGDVNSCNPGTTAPAFQEAVLLRINYFRAMAGVPADVTFREEYNHKAQAAALMMSANGKLSHFPNVGWKCYTEDGAEAARHSNLYLGVYGPDAIDGYIRDAGDNNFPVGHRRWILYPQTQQMGTGDIPALDGKWGANALWVIDPSSLISRPKVRDDFVAWPPPGYVPYPVVYSRWSFSYPQADFSTSHVSMASRFTNIPVSQLQLKEGSGENTLVWESRLPSSARGAYTISVSHVFINGVERDFGYTVVIYDPDAPPVLSVSDAESITTTWAQLKQRR